MCLTRYPGRIIAFQFVLTLMVSTALILGGSELASAQQASNSAAHPQPAAQSAPAPIPPAQTQAPVPAQQSPTPASSNAKPHKAKCQHPANPGKRRFGCKDEDFDWEETLTA